jgi:hypothetical protein
MTPRSLFAIILKIIGLYLIIEAFVFLPQLVSTLYQYGRMMMESPRSEILEIGFYIVLSLGIYILALRLCLFKTDWLIDKLHLDKGFSEEKLELNIHRSNVLKIAVIVIGAVMVIDSLPLLCKQTISYLQMSHTYTRFIDNRSTGWMVYYFVKFVAGFCLVSANRPIVNYIELKRKGPATKTAESTSG